jgi:hypothetical protein
MCCPARASASESEWVSALELASGSDLGSATVWGLARVSALEKAWASAKVSGWVTESRHRQ